MIPENMIGSKKTDLVQIEESMYTTGTIANIGAKTKKIAVHFWMTIMIKE